MRPLRPSPAATHVAEDTESFEASRGGWFEVCKRPCRGPHRASSANLSKSNTESPWCKTRPRPAATVAAMRQNGIVWNRLRPFQPQPHAGRAVPPSKTSRSARPLPPGAIESLEHQGGVTASGSPRDFPAFSAPEIFQRVSPSLPTFPTPRGIKSPEFFDRDRGPRRARLGAKFFQKHFFGMANAVSSPTAIDVEQHQPPGGRRKSTSSWANDRTGCHAQIFFAEENF